MRQTYTREDRTIDTLIEIATMGVFCSQELAPCNDDFMLVEDQLDALYAKAETLPHRESVVASRMLDRICAAF